MLIFHVISTVELSSIFIFFFFNDTATTEIYTLSLHDALPISARVASTRNRGAGRTLQRVPRRARPPRVRLHRSCDAREDRKSTRLNSSHLVISYAVFCLKKKSSFISSLIWPRCSSSVLISDCT